MLKQRLITALLLIPLFVWLVLALPTHFLALLLGGVVLLGAREWAHLYAWTGAIRTRFMIFMVVGLALCFGAAATGVGTMLMSGLVTASWVALTVWLWRRRADPQQVEAGIPWCVSQRCRWALGAFVLWSPFLALLTLHAAPNWGPAYVVFCLSSMWVADSAAYFAGRQFGRRKLAPAISPGKSWEGVAGAMIASALWAWLATWWLPVPGEGSLGGMFVVACLLMVALSIAGDLFESQLKRSSHVKDSGALLPGHGGVLDRIDSTTAAAPALLFFLGMVS